MCLTVCHVRENSRENSSFHPLCEPALINAIQIDGVSGKKFAGNKIKNVEDDRKSVSKKLVRKENRKIQDKIYPVTREDTLECTGGCSRRQKIQDFQDIASHLSPMEVNTQQQTK